MISKQILKFSVVGLLSTVVNYSLFYLLFKIMGIYYIIASAVGFFLGVLVGYTLNKNWTFGGAVSTANDVYKYYMVYLLSLLISLAFLKFLVVVLGLEPAIANCLMICLSTCINFVGIKCWVFKK